MTIDVFKKSKHKLARALKFLKTACGDSKRFRSISEGTKLVLTLDKRGMKKLFIYCGVVELFHAYCYRVLKYLVLSILCFRAGNYQTQ